ncbi:NEDD4-like E3 ubiquitin-protein ligase WWP1 [Acipenser ruthenus]|uniref:NEDD4-like E3 ubiquitin-protein ligase WWP1 n=1 Tax=Acipenser ruthenus TaxID=7906 RepID=A0A662YYA1_ACIRT|nr:NEDD4-like E3 ubiquitin-protein ligase WWP1 [Acipenser ruthenus]
MAGYSELYFNVDSGYLEGLVRGFKAGILKQIDYQNLVQCETVEVKSWATVLDWDHKGFVNTQFKAVDSTRRHTIVKHMGKAKHTLNANTAASDMATASPRCDSSNNHNGRSQLYATVSCAKFKRKKNWFGTAIYVEVAADGEAKKTAKSSSSSHPKWEERLTVNVTPHTKLEFKVWSHYTLKADALLGKATLDISQALELHNRKLENVKEVLKLTLENKNGLVQTGELTVVLDGLTVDQESLPNGTAPATKVQQNGDAIHENRGESSTGARTRSTSGASNGIECQAASTSSGQSESSTPLVNGDGTPSPSHVAARPNVTLYPKPPNNHSNHSTDDPTSDPQLKDHLEEPLTLKEIAQAATALHRVNGEPSPPAFTPEAVESTSGASAESSETAIPSLSTSAAARSASAVPAASVSEGSPAVASGSASPSSTTTTTSGVASSTDSTVSTAADGAKPRQQQQQQQPNNSSIEPLPSGLQSEGADRRTSFLERDSMYTVTERKVKHAEVYLPSDYYCLAKEACFHQPYKVTPMTHNDFVNWSSISDHYFKKNAFSGIASVHYIRYEKAADEIQLHFRKEISENEDLLQVYFKAKS